MDSDSDSRSDAELLRTSARDPEAFGVFYDRHAATLLAYFQRRTACPESAADLAADVHPAVTTHERAVGYRDVLARAQLAAAFVLLAALDRDAVVADVDVTVADADVAAGVGVDAVGVGRLRRVADGDAADRDVVARQRSRGCSGSPAIC